MKKILKNILNNDSYLYKLLSKIYNRSFWKPEICNRNFLKEYATLNNKIKFIQIGSNNGINGDDLHEYIINNNWTGILIEPVVYLFDELKFNYKEYCDRLIFENSAISNTNGQLDFYRLQKSNLLNLPSWYEEIGSFNKEIVLKHIDRIPQIEDLIIKEKINAITFKDLIEKYDVKEINLLNIDTEGYDYEILKMIPFKDFEIDMIIFEHLHLSESDYKNSVKLLKKQRYRLCTSKSRDTIAIHYKLEKLLSSQFKSSISF